MNLGLQGKGILITGGSRGIGRAIALTCAAEGANVAICGRGQEDIDQALRDLSAYNVHAFGYADEDEELKNEIAQHLAVLKRKDILNEYYDHNISAGTNRIDETGRIMNRADIILLLVSKNFIGSDYCYSVELEQALKRHEAGEARVVPVMLSPVHWEGTALDQLQALPSNRKCITDWRDRNKAYVDITKNIERVIKEITKNA